MKMATTVTGTTAESQLTTDGTPSQKVDMIDEAAVLLLAGSIFAPYEAVAARLRAAAPGTTLPVYRGSTRVGCDDRRRVGAGEHPDARTTDQRPAHQNHTRAAGGSAATGRRSLGRRGGPAAPRERPGAEPGCRAGRRCVGLGAPRHRRASRRRTGQDSRKWVLAGGNDLEAGRCRRQTAAGPRARRRVGPDRSR